MTEYFADLHCHSTLFCYNRLYPNTWFERYFPIFPAQGDFAQLARGKVRVVMVSLYPIEQGFVTAKPLGLGTGNLTDFLAKVVVDIPKSRADEIQLYDHDYFDDLMKELDFLNQSAYPVTRRVYQNPYRRKRYNYRIVKDYNSLKALLEIDDNYRPGNACDQNIAVILTMEG
ncbi:MAG TPA: hypothetical protein PLK12_04760, partial [Prolixibacteraceae bacterium]|nr:hypothetical protein [Prolixibacteraceae bacterium]